MEPVAGFRDSSCIEPIAGFRALKIYRCKTLYCTEPICCTQMLSPRELLFVGGIHTLHLAIRKMVAFFDLIWSTIAISSLDETVSTERIVSSTLRCSIDGFIKTSVLSFHDTPCCAHLWSSPEHFTRPWRSVGRSVCNHEIGSLSRPLLRPDNHTR